MKTLRPTQDHMVKFTTVRSPERRRHHKQRWMNCCKNMQKVKTGPARCTTAQIFQSRKSPSSSVPSGFAGRRPTLPCVSCLHIASANARENLNIKRVCLCKRRSVNVASGKYKRTCKRRSDTVQPSICMRRSQSGTSAEEDLVAPSMRASAKRGLTV